MYADPAVELPSAYHGCAGARVSRCQTLDSGRPRAGCQLDGPCLAAPGTMTAVAAILPLAIVLAAGGSCSSTYIAHPASHANLKAIEVRHPSRALKVEASDPPSAEAVEGYLVAVGPTTVDIKSVVDNRLLTVDNDAIRQVSYKSAGAGAGAGAALGFLAGAIAGGTTAGVTYSDPCAKSTGGGCLSFGPEFSVLGTAWVVGSISALLGTVVGASIGASKGYVFKPAVPLVPLP